MKDVKDIVSQVDALPPLPSTAMTLVTVASDPRSSIDDIVDVIKYDEALTSQLLRLCNSAYYGLSRTVTSLNDALMCLGTAKVMQLVMAVHTGAILSRGQSGYGLAPGMLWKHSVAVANGSSILAMQHGDIDVGTAFTAGLLHDIGKVILNEYVAEEYGRILEMVDKQEASFAEAEHLVLGFNHQEIGALVAEKWNLPESLILCIRHHHDPETPKPSDALVDIVHVANCVCLMMGLGLGNDGLLSRADADAVARLKMHEHDLESLGAQMTLELKRVEQMFEGTAGTSG